MIKKNLRTLHFSLYLSLLLIGSTNYALAFDTSIISSTPTTAISLVDYETYDFGGRTINGSNITDNGLFRCFGRRGVTIKNVTVTGSPRYALIARGCSSFTIENFHMVDNPNSIGGIRFDQGTENKTVTINGVTADNQGGHALELWDVNGFTIGDFYAEDTSKCGLLVNRSRNGSIAKVTGWRNNQYGGYATMRFANNAGPNLSVSKVFSRDSGRGLFTVTGSSGITVNNVDIYRSYNEGIYIQDGYDVQVLNGIARGTTNCRIRGGANSSINSVDCGGAVEN